MAGYADMTDEDKIRLAIECKARGTPLPAAIMDFLISVGLYDTIMNPKGT